MEIVRGLYDAFRRRDNEAPFEVYDEEIEWDVSRMAELLGGDLGLAGVYRGHEGVRDYWLQWLTAWETIEFEIGEFTPIRECVLVGPISQRMRGRASGIEVAIPDWWHVWWLRDGKVTRTVAYAHRDEALIGIEAD